MSEYAARQSKAGPEEDTAMTCARQSSVCQFVKRKGMSYMKRHQMSESILLYFVLALSGGCMDAYSYLFRDEVFANAQTGNMLLFGVYMVEQNYAAALKYLWPILAFSFGIVLSDVIRHKTRNTYIHWRQTALVVEIIILFLVSGFSQERNNAANALISFACGVQVETFRSVRGNAIATTMCIGNLRSGIYNFDTYLQTKNKDHLKKASIYLGVNLVFVIGAMIESVLIQYLAEKALYFSVGMLILAFVLMLRSPGEPPAECSGV